MKLLSGQYGCGSLIVGLYFMNEHIFSLHINSSIRVELIANCKTTGSSNIHTSLLKLISIGLIFG